MTNITWEHKQLNDMHAIKGHFLEHDSYVKAVVSPKGWNFYFGLGKELSELSNSFQNEIVKILFFSLLSTVQQENPLLFQTLINVSELNQKPYSFLINRKEKTYLSELGMKELDVDDPDNMSFILQGYLVDDIYYRKYFVEYVINEKEIEKKSRNLALSKEEKEVLSKCLNFPKTHVEKEPPFELIEKEIFFKEYMKRGKKLFEKLHSLRKPDVFTYEIISAEYDDIFHFFTFKIKELPFLSFNITYEKNEISKSRCYISDDDLDIHHTFSLESYALFLQKVHEYFTKKSIYRVRLLM